MNNLESVDLASRLLDSTPLDTVRSRELINTFREKYHAGDPEGYIPEKYLVGYFERFESEPPQFIPDDILVFRQANYPSSYVKLIPLTLVHRATWMSLAMNSFPTDWRILLEEGFLKEPIVYCSLFSLGDAIFKVKPQKIKELFLDHTEEYFTNIDTIDHYIFPKSLKWCIIITHGGHYLIAGDFEIF